MELARLVGKGDSISYTFLISSLSYEVSRTKSGEIRVTGDEEVRV